MELPTEIWRLIIEDYDIQTYKNCILVNKLFYKIIKQFLDSIPDKIQITWEMFEGKILHEENRIINPNNTKEIWINRDNVGTPPQTYIGSNGLTFNITKCDVLNSRWVRNISLSFSVPLPMKLILSKKQNAITIKYTARYVPTGSSIHIFFCYV